jgi:hypothetical protein
VLISTSFRYSWILLIPIAFVVVFQALLNTESKYQPSLGGVSSFLRAFAALLILLGIFGLLVLKASPAIRGRYLLMSSSVLLAYAGLFPYYAVGYNPLADVLPWRMRSRVLEDLWYGLPVSFLIFLFVAVVSSVAARRLRDNSVRPAVVIGILVMIFGFLYYWVGKVDFDTRNWYFVWPVGAVALMAMTVLLAAWLTSSQRRKESQISMWVVVVGASAFAACCYSIGPMDWDSRNWLVAWPLLTIVLVSSLLFVPSSLRRVAGACVFVVMLVSSAAISSEYFVDSLKQRAIIQATRRELKPQIVREPSEQGRAFIVVRDVNTPNRLNARFREYRPYEWWGLLANGLEIPARQLQLLDAADVDGLLEIDCTSPMRVLQIRPVVKSSRLEVLREWRVVIDMNPSNITLCSVDSPDGWPRVKTPKAEE